MYLDLYISALDMYVCAHTRRFLYLHACTCVPTYTFFKNTYNIHARVHECASVRLHVCVCRAYRDRCETAVPASQITLRAKSLCSPLKPTLRRWMKEWMNNEWANTWMDEWMNCVRGLEVGKTAPAFCLPSWMDSAHLTVYYWSRKLRSVRKSKQSACFHLLKFAFSFPPSSTQSF